MSFDPEPGEVLEDIPLSHIRIDGGAQHRLAINPDHVMKILAGYKAGRPIPPIKVCRDPKSSKVIWPWDYAHRLEARKKGGYKTIPAHVRIGTQRDALFLSCSANTSHGLDRTNDDIRRQLETVLRDTEWAALPNTTIAEHCAVDEKTVRNHRARLSSEVPKMRTVKVSRGGKEYDLEVGNIGQRMLQHMTPEEQLDVMERASTLEEKEPPPPPRLKVVTRDHDPVADLRVTLALPEDLAEVIDAQARRRGVNRERMCVVALQEYFEDGGKPRHGRQKSKAA